MGRNIGGHAHGNTARTIDQHIGKARRQNRGFAIFAVVIVLKINRVFFDIGQQGRGRFVHAHFGIAHGGGAVAIHRAKVALPIQQGQRHRKILGHPHQRVVNRAIAMGVVFTHDIPHRTGGFAVRFVMRIAAFVHRIQNAAMHRL